MIWINLAFTLTVAAAVILLVKKLLGTKITPRGHMLMWLIIAVQMIGAPAASFLPEMEWALRNHVPQFVEIRQVQPAEPGMGYEAGSRLTLGIPGPDLSLDRGIEIAGTTFEETNLLVLIWILGCISVLSVLITGYIRNQKKLEKLKLCSDAHVSNVLLYVKWKLKLKRDIELKVGADRIMLTGFSQPVIYMPDPSVYSDEELHHIFAHEITHYQHRDLLLNGFSVLLLAVFWWNPVFWAAVRHLHQDMEVYCDWDAVRHMGQRKEYAKTLVRAAGEKKPFVAASTSLIYSRSQLSRRITALAKYKQPVAWLWIPALCVLLGLCLSLAVPSGAGSVRLQMDLDDVQSVRTKIQRGNNGSDGDWITEEQLEELVNLLNAADFIPSAANYAQARMSLIGRHYKKIVFYADGNEFCTVRYCEHTEDAADLVYQIRVDWHREGTYISKDPALCEWFRDASLG